MGFKMDGFSAMSCFQISFVGFPLNHNIVENVVKGRRFSVYTTGKEIHSSKNVCVCAVLWKITETERTLTTFSTNIIRKKKLLTVYAMHKAIK